MSAILKEVSKSIIALDISTKSTGYAYCMVSPRRKLLKQGFIRPDEANEGNVYACAADVASRLCIMALPTEFYAGPMFIFAESAFAGRNMKVFGQLSIMRGAVITELLRRSREAVVIEDVAPASWRKVVNEGQRFKKRDKKQQTIDMVKNLFGVLPENNDVADALGIMYYASKVMEFKFSGGSK